MEKQKISFSTFEEANTELKRIINTKFNVCKCKKPNRTYQDPRDNLWYLTSKPIITTY